MNFMSIVTAIGEMFSKVVSVIGEAAKKSKRYILNTVYGFQLKAKIMPYSTCFSHSVSNLLSSIDIKVTPDEITAAVNSAEYQQWVRDNVSWATAYIGRLQTVWQVQERYINQMLVKFGKTQYKPVMSWNTSREFVMETLNLRFPVVTDTYPVYYKTGQKLGHIVAIVGYAYGYIPQAEDFPSPALFNEYVTKFGSEARDCYIVDDPFGNMLSGYLGNENAQPVIGDDIILPFEWFDSGVRGKVSLTLRSK